MEKADSARCIQCMLMKIGSLVSKVTAENINVDRNSLGMRSRFPRVATELNSFLLTRVPYDSENN
jgi:transketolase C-terminal domain/subunit